MRDIKSKPLRLGHSLELQRLRHGPACYYRLEVLQMVVDVAQY